MTTATTDPLADLAQALTAGASGTTTDLTRFSSGGAMLDVRRDDGRLFVLAYAPTSGYGVDEVGADDGLVTGYRFAYSDFASAAKKLRDLVAGDQEALPAPPKALNLVVVQARDLETSKSF